MFMRIPPGIRLMDLNDLLFMLSVPLALLALGWLLGWLFRRFIDSSITPPVSLPHLLRRHPRHKTLHRWRRSAYGDSKPPKWTFHRALRQWRLPKPSWLRAAVI
jgi:hypothetical protein